MLYLEVNDDFSYLNYLSVMSAIRVDDVSIWFDSELSNNPYWHIICKCKFINLVWTPKYKREVPYRDKIGLTDIIYLGELKDNYIEEASIDYPGLYEVNGEFDRKDMCLVRVFRPEVVTLDYVKGDTLLANLIKRVLLERVWNPYGK